VWDFEVMHEYTCAMQVGKGRGRGWTVVVITIFCNCTFVLRKPFLKYNAQKYGTYLVDLFSHSYRRVVKVRIETGFPVARHIENHNPPHLGEVPCD